MKKWKDMKGWQKGSVIGFSVLGTGHIFLVTFDLVLEGGSAFIHPLGIPVFEFPLYVLYVYVYLLFKIEIIPQPGSIVFWIWIYLCGTIAWGVVGTVVGFIFGLLSDFSSQGLKEDKK